MGKHLSEEGNGWPWHRISYFATNKQLPDTTTQSSPTSVDTNKLPSLLRQKLPNDSSHNQLAAPVSGSRTVREHHEPCEILKRKLQQKGKAW